MSERSRRLGRPVAILGLLLIAGGATALWYVKVGRWERRARALEAQLEEDLDASAHARPQARTRLERPASPGELGAALEAALALVPRDVPARAAGELQLERPAHTMGWQLPTKLSPDGVRFREELAPAVAAVRSALACEKVAPGYDHERLLRAGSRFDGRALRLGAAGFVAEALAQLEAGHALEAARLAGELWQLERDVARTGPLTELLQAELVVGGAAQGLTNGIGDRLDPAARDALDADLLRLLQATPSYARAVEAERLEVGLAYRERIHERAGSRPDAEDPFGEMATELPLAAPLFARWPGRKLRDVVTEGEAVDQLLRIEAAGAPPEPGTPARNVTTLVEKLRAQGGSQVRAVEQWGDLVAKAHGCWLAETARLRLAHAWLACLRWREKHGDLPASLEEALGHAPGVAETDPVSGEPFAILGQRGGVLALAAKTQGLGAQDTWTVAGDLVELDYPGFAYFLVPAGR